MPEKSAINISIINRVATNEDEPPFSDELDKLIELKATRNSHYVFVLGFVVAMALLVIKDDSRMPCSYRDLPGYCRHFDERLIYEIS